MKYKIINEKEYKTTEWSGGKTSEIYIYPENSVYSERNFGFRISTALIENEKSEFTHLEGIKRSLMVLEKPIVIINDGKKINLDIFKEYRFSGSDNIISLGKTRDFNAMTKEGFTGEIVYLEIEENEISIINKKSSWIFIYIFKGYAEINGLKINEKDTFVLWENDGRIKIQGIKRSDIICTFIDIK